MARNLRLQVILNAVDQATRPLRSIDRASQGASQAMRENRDRLKQLQTTQKDVSSFRNLSRQSTSTATALREQQERIRRLSQQMRSNQGDTTALATERQKAIAQARRLTQRYDNERQQLQRLRTSLNNNGVSTAHLARDQRRLSSDIQQANTAVDEQRHRLKRLAEQQRNTARARGQYDRTMNLRNSMAGTGAGMMASGGAALYAGARLMAPGVAWAEQMSTLQAVGRFTAEDERYQALRQQSRDLGGSTAFSASEVGSGQEFLLRAGMSSEAIRASMRDVLDLALANNTELGRAADIASNIAGTFKVDMEADGAMARVADILSGTASRANVNLEMLGETMKYLGGAEDLKLTMEQAAAMSGMLGNIGIQGSQSGTTMRTMMNRLTNPAAKGAAAIENIGLQVADATGNMRAMPEILRDISQATADLGNVERKAIMQDIFGVEAGSGMAELVDAMGGGQLDAIINALGDNMGENARMAKTMADNIGGDLKGLRSAWEEVGISITDTNNGPLRDLIQNVTAITRGVGRWINENPRLAGTITRVAAILAVLVTAGGMLTLMLASILGPIAMVRFGMAMVGPQILMAGKAMLWLGGVFRTVSMFFLANPIGIAIAAIAAAAYLIYRYWEPIKAFFQGLWQQVKEAFDNGISGVAQLLMNWSPLGLLYQGITSALTALGVEIPTQFRSLGSAMVDGLIGGLTGKLGELRDRVTGMAGNVRGWFANVLDINSPSRVFTQLGGYTVDGLNKGLDAQRNEPARRIQDIARRVTRAGAGLALGAAALPAAAMPHIEHQAPIQFDTRPPLSAPSTQAGGGITIEGGINIHVTPAPGMNEQQLAKYVAQEVQRALANAQRDAQARRRSSLRDLD
ncbi:phage tail tape measure protein [Vreelandella olivaria]|uniref:phage tail tape measure protein n=1 Tax=Vreelandella olivaria TaxID=390919 RepID=UPI00201FB3B4